MSASKARAMKKYEKLVNLDFIESTLQKIFALRQSDLLSSRIKFKI